MLSADTPKNFLARAVFENSFDKLGLVEIKSFEFAVDGARMNANLAELGIINFEKVLCLLNATLCAINDETFMLMGKTTLPGFCSKIEL